MTHIVKEGRLLKLPEVQKPDENNGKYWHNGNFKQEYYFKSDKYFGDLEDYNNWLSSGITISKDLNLEEGKEYCENVDFKIGKCSCEIGYDCPNNPSKWFTPCSIAIPVSTELKNEDGVIEKALKELCCDFAFECGHMIAKAKYSDVRLRFDVWFSESNYHINKINILLTKEENKV